MMYLLVQSTGHMSIRFRVQSTGHMSIRSLVQSTGHMSVCSIVQSTGHMSVCSIVQSTRHKSICFRVQSTGHQKWGNISDIYTRYVPQKVMYYNNQFVLNGSFCVFGSKSDIKDHTHTIGKSLK